MKRVIIVLFPGHYRVVAAYAINYPQNTAGRLQSGRQRWDWNS